MLVCLDHGCSADFEQGFWVFTNCFPIACRGLLVFLHVFHKCQQLQLIPPAYPSKLEPKNPLKIAPDQQVCSVPAVTPLLFTVCWTAECSRNCGQAHSRHRQVSAVGFGCWGTQWRGSFCNFVLDALANSAIFRWRDHEPNLESYRKRHRIGGVRSGLFLHNIKGWFQNATYAIQRWLN